MTTSWLHALLGIIHNAKHHKTVCENKETDSPSDIYRMKLLGTCSLSKESHEKKKMGLLFWGSGTPTFWLGLLLFTKRESLTPTFKILVRTLPLPRYHPVNLSEKPKVRKCRNNLPKH